MSVILDCPCKLLKQDTNTSNWLEYHKLTRIYVSKYGISIRDTDQFSLVGDFPFHSLIKCELLSTRRICRILVKSNHLNESNHSIPYGLKLENETDYLSIVAELSKHQVYCEMTSETSNTNVFESLFPNLIDPEVDDYVVRLLFNDDYRQFVISTSKFIESLSEKIDVNNNSSSHNEEEEKNNAHDNDYENAHGKNKEESKESA